MKSEKSKLLCSAAVPLPLGGGWEGAVKFFPLGKDLGEGLRGLGGGVSHTVSTESTENGSSEF